MTAVKFLRDSTPNAPIAAETAVSPHTPMAGVPYLVSSLPKGTGASVSRLIAKVTLTPVLRHARVVPNTAATTAAAATSIITKPLPQKKTSPVQGIWSANGAPDAAAMLMG